MRALVRGAGEREMEQRQNDAENGNGDANHVPGLLARFGSLSHARVHSAFGFEPASTDPAASPLRSFRRCHQTVS